MKCYFNMINSDQDFEMLDEIDKWRFICFCMLEIQSKKPVLLDEKYLIRKGFDFKKQKLNETLKNLSNLIEVIGDTDVTEDKNSVTKPLPRVDKNRIEKDIYGELNNVKLTKDEFIKLQEKFGNSKAVDKINNLSCYIKAKGDKYKSHYATILMWSKKDQKQNPVNFIEPKQKEIF